MNINPYTSHPSAFISSTFLDLEQERKTVAKVLRELNFNINAIDIKPASTNSSRNEILNGIKESDFIILIVGERYGSIIPNLTFSKTLSITRWEYERAIKGFKKNVLVFFKKVESKNSINYDDPKDIVFKSCELRKFKTELSNTHNPKYFRTMDELVEEIRKAVIPTYRAGIISLNKVKESLAHENEVLKSKVGNLELENEKLKIISTTKNNIQIGLSNSAPNPPQLGVFGSVKNENLPRLGLSSYIKSNS